MGPLHVIADCERRAGEEVERARRGRVRCRGERPRGAGLHPDAPDGDIGVRARGPRARRRRRRPLAVERARDDGDLGRLAGAVDEGGARDVLVPEHREVRLDELVLAREVQPDLEELDGVGLALLEEREHLGVDDPSARGQPLDVAAPEARRGAERVGVIDVAAARDRDRLEPAVRVLREPGYDAAVVHPPAVLALEVLPEVATGERGRRPHALVARGVGVVVVDAEQERVRRLPREAERAGAEDEAAHRANLTHARRPSRGAPSRRELTAGARGR